MRISCALGFLVVGLSLSFSSGLFAVGYMESNITQLVNQARQHVKEHNKEAWLDAFAATGSVTDPMGTPSYIGREALGHFNDALIASNNIQFEDEGRLTNALSQWRRTDVVIEKGASVTRVPAYIHYQFVAEGKALKLQRVNAYWYMPAIQMGFGEKLRRAGPMLRHLGLIKTWKFFRDGTWRTIGQDAVRGGRLSDMCEVTHIKSTGEREIVASNNFSRISYENPIVSGYFVASKSSLQLVDRINKGKNPMEGVAVIHFSKKKNMTQIEFYEGEWISTKLPAADVM